MSIRSIRKLLWSPKSRPRPVAFQLEFDLPPSGRKTGGEEAAAELRKLRESLAGD